VQRILIVHQICAAIQSIGVCRRELEGQKQWTIGKCILPAILLHGLFDFVIFITSFEFGLYAPSNTNHDDQSKDANVLSDDIAWTTADGSLNYLLIFLNLGLPLLIAAAGLIYYWRESRSQTLRLKSIDEQSDVTDQVEAVV